MPTDDNHSLDSLTNLSQPTAAAGASNASTDSELVRFVCEGDETAFELIFERHKARVVAIAGRFFQEGVEDVLQECFARAYFALPNFVDRGQGSFAAWIAKIAFNACYDELRKRGRRRESPIDDLTEAEVHTVRALTTQPEGISVESWMVTRDLANRLLAQLSPEDRLVLVLLDVEALSVAEIGEVMNWSPAKVKIRVFRARSHLRRLLAKFL